jgi:hypothetical protein
MKNDFGVVATKSEINKIKRDTKKAQRVAETILKESEMKPIIQNGKVVATQGQERLMMGGRNKGISVPNDFDFSKVRSKSRLKEVAENMEKKAKGQFYRDRSKKMQDTFIRELAEAFNSDANDLIEKLKKLDPEEFLDMYNMYESFDFPNFYLMEYVDDSVQDMYLRKMETDVERYINGVDPSLKGF